MKAASKQRINRYPDMDGLENGRTMLIAALAMGRKRISGFDMKVGVLWQTWGCYGSFYKWLFSVDGFVQSSEIPNQKRLAPILYMMASVTILGLYFQIQFYNIGKIKMGTGTTVPPYLLKDAIFARASKKSALYCWIKTSDGFTYAMTLHQTRRLSCRCGKGPIRFRKWLVEQDSEKWNSCVEETEKWVNPSKLSTASSEDNGNTSEGRALH